MATETGAKMVDILFKICTERLDETYLYTVLLTFRCHLTCSQLLTTFETFVLTNSKSDDSTLGATVRILASWIDWFPDDFRHDSCLMRIQSLVANVPGLAGLLAKLQCQLDSIAKHEAWLVRQHSLSTVQPPTTSLLSSSSRPGRVRSAKARATSVACSIKAAALLATAHSSPIIASNHLHSHCQDNDLCSYLESRCAPVYAKTMADQLTRIELAHLSHLDASQMLAHIMSNSSSSCESVSLRLDLCAISSEASSTRTSVSSTASSLLGDTTSSESRLFRSREGQMVDKVDAYIAWFNRLTYLTATTVCQCRRRRCRVAVIEFWTEVGRHCINLANFNSLSAIMSGLSLCPVARLRRTWDRITSRASGGKFNVLEHQIDPRANFTSYRSTYRAALSRSQSATSDEQRIAIPFFSLVMKDIVMAKQCGALTSVIDILETLILVKSGSGSSRRRIRSGPEDLEELGESLQSAATAEVSPALNLAMKCHAFDSVRLAVRQSPFNVDSEIEEWLFQQPLMTDEELDFHSYVAEDPASDFDRDRFKTLKSHMRSRSHSTS